MKATQFIHLKVGRAFVLSINCLVFLTSCSAEMNSTVIMDLHSRGLESGLVLGSQAGPGRLQFLALLPARSIVTDIGRHLQVQTISPNGRTIVAKTEVLSELVVTTISGSSRVEVDPDEYSGQPTLALSWDDSHLAVCGQFKSRGRLFYGVKIFSLSKGSFEVYPFDEATLTAQCGQMAWRPDGRELFVEFGGDVYVINRESKIVTRRFVGYLPAWSPDGQSFSLRTASKELSLFSADGRRIRSLVSGTQIVELARWSPDGRYIVFGEEGGGSLGGLWLSVLDVAQENVARLTPLAKRVGKSTGWIYLDPKVVRSAETRGRE